MAYNFFIRSMVFPAQVAWGLTVAELRQLARHSLLQGLLPSRERDHLLRACAHRILRSAVTLSISCCSRVVLYRCCTTILSFVYVSLTGSLCDSGKSRRLDKDLDAWVKAEAARLEEPSEGS